MRPIGRIFRARVSHPTTFIGTSPFIALFRPARGVGRLNGTGADFRSCPPIAAFWARERPMTRPPTPPGGSISLTDGCSRLTSAADGSASISSAGWQARWRVSMRNGSLSSRKTAFTSGRSSTVAMTLYCSLEADNPTNRSNDARVHPCGTFWIGTMGRNAEAGAGAIYALYRGEISRLFAGGYHSERDLLLARRRGGLFYRYGDE